MTNQKSNGILKGAHCSYCDKHMTLGINWHGFGINTNRGSRALVGVCNECWELIKKEDIESKKMVRHIASRVSDWMLDYSEKTDMKKTTKSALVKKFDGYKAVSFQFTNSVKAKVIKV